MIEFSPGPSQIYPKVPEFLDDAVADGVMSMSHRSSAFADLYKSVTDGLRDLLGVPDEYHIWFLGSATEAMERIIQNTVQQRSHHFVNGAFSERFSSIAAELGKLPSVFTVPWGEGYDLHDSIVPDGAELIAVTMNETSTGVAINPDAIAELHQRYPEKLLAVDIVSAVPHVVPDFSRLDCAFFSVQKGFGLPAGLGVLIASPHAMRRSERLRALGDSIGSYHSFAELSKHETKYNTPETPNVLGIYLLDRVTKDLLRRGPDGIRTALDVSAANTYTAIENHPLLSPAVVDTNFRSKTVVVAAVLGGSVGLIAYMKDRGFSIGAGYGQQKSTHVRIANFPAHLSYTEQLLNALRAYK